MEDAEGGGDLHLYWEMLIFVAALLSVSSVVVEFTVRVSEETEHLLHLIDYGAVLLFAVDIAWKYSLFRCQSAGGAEFIRRNWLDIVAVVPLFRIFRLGRFARLARISRARVTSRAVEAAERAHKGISGVAHGRHVGDGLGGFGG